MRTRRRQGPPDFDSDAMMRLYFEPSLAALLVADRRTALKKNEISTLDGDPFINGQD
jgi:hypothetical protein